MENHRFFQHTQCTYFPCHKTANPEDFNCLFCFCPLYALGSNCGGHFVYTDSGIKDCSYCTFPHNKDNYEKVLEKLQQVIELSRKKPE